MWRHRDLVQDPCPPPAPPRRVAPLTCPAVSSDGEAMVRPVILHLEPAAGAQGADGSLAKLESSQLRKSGQYFEGHLFNRGDNCHSGQHVAVTVGSGQQGATLTQINDYLLRLNEQKCAFQKQNNGTVYSVLLLLHKHSIIFLKDYV